MKNINVKINESTEHKLYELSNILDVSSTGAVRITIDFLHYYLTGEVSEDFKPILIEIKRIKKN